MWCCYGERGPHCARKAVDHAVVGGQVTIEAEPVRVQEDKYGADEDINRGQDCSDLEHQFDPVPAIGCPRRWLRIFWEERLGFLIATLGLLLFRNKYHIDGKLNKGISLQDTVL